MIGKTVSHYKITRELGAGGMGVVYEAVDTKLDRTVALKFLPPESTRDPDAKARFVHEAKAASAIDHPNVCNIYEIDETDDGQLFLAMACYEGETLKDRIERGPLPLNDALDITRQVSEGLTKAHERDIVHRDIKPANIFITSDGVVKILDFGLAKLAGLTQLTQEGTTLGTAHYMSPEQANGQEVDHRSDLWCLGVCLYEMITGLAPFQGDHPQAVTYAILNSDPERVTGLRSGVPLELERIIGKCLAKDPGERYQHAEDLVADLRHLQRESREGTTVPPVRGSVGASSLRRWPWMMGFLGLGAVLAIVSWLIWPNTDSKTSTEEMSLAIVEFEDLDATKYQNRASGLSFLLNTGLIEGSPIRVVSSSLIQHVRRRRFGESQGPIERDRALEVAREAKASHLLTGAIVPGSSGGNVTWQLVETVGGSSLGGDRVEIKDLAPLADEIVAGVLPLLSKISGVQSVPRGLEVSSLVSNSPEAYRWYMEGRRAFYEYRHSDAIQALERAVRVDSTFALAHFLLSRALFSTRSRDEIVKRPADAAWKFRERLSVKDRMRLEGWRKRLEWRSQEALGTYEEMLVRWPDDRETLVSLVELYHYLVYHVSAVRVSTQALNIYPDDPYFKFYLGACLPSIGKPKEALNFNREIVRQEPNNPNAWDELGLRYLQVAKPDSAEGAFRNALAIQPDFFPSMHGLASASYCRGDLASAISLMGQLLSNENLPRGHQAGERTDLIYLDGLTFFLLEAGLIEQAMEVVDEARKYVQGPEELARFMREKSWLLVRIGRPQEALASVDSLLPYVSEERYVKAAIIDIKVKSLVALGLFDAALVVVSEMRLLEGAWGSDASNLADLAEAKMALSSGDCGRATKHLEAMMVEGVPRLNLYELEWRETWTELHRLEGRLEDAEADLQELLGLYGGHALAHYDLGKLYEEMNRIEDSAEEYGLFLEMWSEADDGLPQIEDARSRLTALRSRQ